MTDALKSKGRNSVPKAPMAGVSKSGEREGGAVLWSKGTEKGPEP